MLDSLLQVCYNVKRKILVDFSGFGHLFATQLSYDSCVAFFVVRISEVLAEWRTISVWKIFFCLLSRRAIVYGLSVGAIALGYPAQEAGQPAARKQNNIVRM